MDALNLERGKVVARIWIGRRIKEPRKSLSKVGIDVLDFCQDTRSGNEEIKA